MLAPGWETGTRGGSPPGVKLGSLPVSTSLTNNKLTLRETGDLPSARVFAECILSGTRQRPCLPSARKIHSANKNTRQNTSLPSVFFWHSAKMYFAECLCFGTRQRGFLPCAFFWPSANQFFEAIFEALNEFK